MWKCKHCNKDFDFKVTSEKANHSRWCESNPKRTDTANLKKAQQKLADARLGKLKDFSVNCHNCNTQFDVTEREKQFPSKDKYFCCKSCSNSEGGKAKAIKDEENGNMKYRTLAKKYHNENCVVCGFDKVLDVHHINEQHNDDRKENLIFLCPNHHEMFHSKYRDEIVPHIEKYVEDKWGYNSVERVPPLQGGSRRFESD